MDSYITPINARRCGRSVPIIIVLFFTATFFLALLELTNTSTWRHVVPDIVVDKVNTILNDSSCHSSPQIWHAAQKKYERLMEDKFT